MDLESLERNLRRHVVSLADEIGERNVFRPHTLHASADYITRVWQGMGYDVHDHCYAVNGVGCANLEVVHAGQTGTDETLVIGAHYDTVRGSPGADDNASGVAGLLELSRELIALDTQLTVRFVAFVNEEAPFFCSGNMGSMVYARAARRSGQRIRLMMSLEMLGYYDDTPGSQSYPPLLSHFYPSRGNFIGFVSNLRSRGMLHETVRAFRAHTDFPAEHIATFAFVPGVALSDHLAFWQQGYRALMVTDTAFYRYPFYHTDFDTSDRLDYASMARVVAGLSRTIATLSNR